MKLKILKLMIVIERLIKIISVEDGGNNDIIDFNLL